MCNCSSPIRWIAVVLLIVAVSGCLVGLLAPFWAYYRPGFDGYGKRGGQGTLATKNDVVKSSLVVGDDDDGEVVDDAVSVVLTAEAARSAEYEGLWARCDADNITDCDFFWQNGFQLENNFPSLHSIY